MTIAKERLDLGNQNAVRHEADVDAPEMLHIAFEIEADPLRQL
jgi:hypothetical protein